MVFSLPGDSSVFSIFDGSVTGVSTSSGLVSVRIKGDNQVVGYVFSGEAIVKEGQMVI
jgi:hypothetical protein